MRVDIWVVGLSCSDEEGRRQGGVPMPANKLFQQRIDRTPAPGGPIPIFFHDISQNSFPTLCDFRSEQFQMYSGNHFHRL